MAYWLFEGFKVLAVLELQRILLENTYDLPLSLTHLFYALLYCPHLKLVDNLVHDTYCVLDPQNDGQYNKQGERDCTHHNPF